jgi:VanZ family protein
MARRRMYFMLLAGWVLLTFVLTSIPNPRFGPDIPHVDKVAHFGFYGVAGFLCALWRRESGRAPWAAVAFAVAFVALLGAVDEIHQYWIPGRSMDLYDWVADLAGGGSGALFSSAAAGRIRFLLSPENRSAPRTATD